MLLKEKTDIFLTGNTTVRLDSHRNIILTKKDQQRSVPLERVGSFVIIGDIDVPAPVLKVCKKYDLALSYLTKGGKFTATVHFGFPKNVHLRVLQTSLHLAPQRKLIIAKQFVRGKCQNAALLLKKVAPKYAKNFAPDNISDLDSLRGHEGALAKSYFTAYGKLLRNKAFSWNGRSKYPPGDAVNALLSTLYTFLIADITHTLELCGLDPYIGFLHDAYYGRPSLACDFLEEFRAAFVDKLVLNFINRKEFTPEDFEEKTVADKKCGVYLTKTGMQKLYPKWSQWYRAEHLESARWQMTCNRKRLVEKQIRHFIHYLLEDEPEYKPFFLKNI